jgi:hypothetical protein
MSATASSATVRVEGAAKVQKAFRGIEKRLATEFGKDLQKAADPVVEATKAKEKWQGASIGTIRSRRRGVNVYVEQSARKVTGKRADYGALQMKQALVPALDENADKVFTEVGHVLDRYAHREGF